ncbi:MAG: isoaspartyl peptidase/L-asparaginase [Candidatus Korarchaeota archaeon]|nr:isoaspartyl peptidase/L-asparaginase [Candidatus Korarchaeota archaeon]
MPIPAIIVHGGAWDLPDHLLEPSIKGVEKAAKEGYRILKEGGSAVDAVERAVIVMEDDPTFDAGVGSVLNEEGYVEMDAIIVDGSALKFGSVAAVRRVKNPVSLARAIMERTENHMFVAEGAEKLALELGLKLVDPKELIVERELRAWKKRRSGTVGAVAVDLKGRVAAATSTGGTPMKKPGRVGDTPLIGCGAYANEIGGASATGEGEPIMRIMLSRLALDILSMGSSPTDAASRALSFMMAKTGGLGGLIVLDVDGRIGYAHTARRMPIAYDIDGDVVAKVSLLD